MGSRERPTSYATRAQYEVLIDFLEANPECAQGWIKDTYGREEATKKWREVAVALNRMGGARKSYKRWQKAWQDKKCTVRKRKLDSLHDESKGQFSANDQRILKLIGMEEANLESMMHAAAETKRAQSTAGISNMDFQMSFKVEPTGPMSTDEADLSTFFEAGDQSRMDDDGFENDDVDVESPTSDGNQSGDGEFAPARYTNEQLDALVDFIEKNPDLVYCNERKESYEKWRSLAVTLNAMGGARKSWQKWFRTWREKRTKVLKKQKKIEDAQTLGSADDANDVAFTPTEERILSLIGMVKSGQSVQQATGSIAEVFIPSQSSKLGHQSPSDECKTYAPWSASDDSTGSRSPGPDEAGGPGDSDEGEGGGPSRRRTNGVTSRQPSAKRQKTTPRTWRKFDAQQPSPSQPLSAGTVYSRLLRLEEQRLKIDRRMADHVQGHADTEKRLLDMVAKQMERQTEMEGRLIDVVAMVGDGLKMLAEAIKTINKYLVFFIFIYLQSQMLHKESCTLLFLPTCQKDNVHVHVHIELIT